MNVMVKKADRSSKGHFKDERTMNDSTEEGKATDAKLCTAEMGTGLRVDSMEILYESLF